MSINERIKLYSKLEQLRGRPLVVYVTSNRQPELASGKIAGDAVSELLLQLQALPEGTTALDLLVVSHGGDPTVAWRIVSLIRERVKEFAFLAPQAAFSAATLIALGADEIIMHPHGNLGPVDPQIVGIQQKEGKDRQIGFGAEDLSAFLDFCKHKVGLSDQQQMLEAFRLVCTEVGAIPIGVAARGSQLLVTMGEKLLRLHMKEGAQAQEARAIVEALNKQFFHHGYPVSRTEAKEMGLKIAETSKDIEDLLWEIWLDIESELSLREPFNPLALLAQNPACAALFDSVPVAQIPTGLPPQVLQQAYQAMLQQISMIQVPPTPFQVIPALVESGRVATRYVTEGKILATRLPDMQIQMHLMVVRSCWQHCQLPTT
ncbi:MAG TPA: hypothetical protein VHB47_22795 [Thermoanaerobaculia bacterium]|jgi:hypothetical protein|nr:hypothetical protein [Thermoanaerobaculia bacterium]